MSWLGGVLGGLWARSSQDEEEKRNENESSDKDDSDDFKELTPSRVTHEGSLGTNMDETMENEGIGDPEDEITKPETESIFEDEEGKSEEWDSLSNDDFNTPETEPQDIKYAIVYESDNMDEASSLDSQSSIETSDEAVREIIADSDLDAALLTLPAVYSTVNKQSGSPSLVSATATAAAESSPPRVPTPDWPDAPRIVAVHPKQKTNLEPPPLDLDRNVNTWPAKVDWRPVKKFWGSVNQLAKPSKLKVIKLQSTRPKKYAFFHQGQSGFEDLRRYIKQGGDFCKELAVILQERSEAEAQYAKTLAKLSSKLIRSTKEGTGTVNTCWHRVGVEMETQSELHRNFAASLSEEVVKPLKQLVDSQHRIRKSVETAVDKSGKNLAEWRTAESKAKKNSFTCARENEKLRDAGDRGESRNRLTANNGNHLQMNANNKTVSEKESAKMESKRRKAEECVKKADVEYYSICLRAERSRLEWESAVIQGSHCFQVLEDERLRGLKDLATCYLASFSCIVPRMVQMNERMKEPLEAVDLSKDLDVVTSLRAATEPSQEQLLPDFYPEQISLAMNRDRRKLALIKLLQLIRADLERERRGKAGVENLAKALKQTPTFANEDSQQNVTCKLHHIRSMLTYLEATRYKIQAALAELEGAGKINHPLANHLYVSRDRQGCQQTILKVPPWVHQTESIELTGNDVVDWGGVDRGTADGTSVQPDSDFDEFSSQGSEKEFESSVIKVTAEPTVQRCKALYNYTANLYDELTLNPGDIINIHDKQPDGWWLGELNGVVGIFPATYVEEITN